MKYFTNINNLEELRKEYKRLVKINHPDNGGSDEEIKIINTEYDLIFIRLRNVNADKAVVFNSDLDTMIRDIINSIINLNVTIEIVGTWIWVSGNTYSIKEVLKGNGFYWASKKKSWYWHAQDDTTTSRGKSTMEEIKMKYGCQTVKTASTIKSLAC